MKELYLLMEEEELNAQHSDNKTCTGDSWTQNTVNSQPISSPVHLFLCLFSDHVLRLFLTAALHRGLELQRVICLVTGRRCLSTVRYISHSGQ